MKRKLGMATVSVALLLVAADAAAQGMGRRYGAGAPRESQQPQRREASPGQEPFAALERELPSLNVDLLLNKDQLDLWRAFERDVRDVAEMGRTQSRHASSLREGGENPPTAMLVIASLAEDERMKNDALADLKRHLEALYAALDDRQKRTLDQRVVQSQPQPLGR